MRETEFRAFSALLDEVWELKGQTLSAGAKAMWFRSMAAYSLDTVRGGLDAHLADPKRGSFLPMPSDVHAQVERAVADDGRPGAEEAWALAMRSTDEADTIIWIAEAAEAMGICRPILSAGDEVGARMAFREAYTRLVDAARRARIAPQWTPSLGHDPGRRDRAIAEAAQRGLLDAGHYPSLPAPRGDMPLLLTGASQSGIPDSARAALLALREWLTTPPPAAESDDARAKAETQRLARETAEKVAKRQGPEMLQ